MRGNFIGRASLCAASNQRLCPSWWHASRNTYHLHTAEKGSRFPGLRDPRTPLLCFIRCDDARGKGLLGNSFIEGCLFRNKEKYRMQFNHNIDKSLTAEQAIELASSIAIGACLR
jgi:hypothetical protein